MGCSYYNLYEEKNLVMKTRKLTIFEIRLQREYTKLQSLNLDSNIAPQFSLFPVLSNAVIGCLFQFFDNQQ